MGDHEDRIKKMERLFFLSMLFALVALGMAAWALASTSSGELSLQKLTLNPSRFDDTALEINMPNGVSGNQVGVKIVMPQSSGIGVQTINGKNSMVSQGNVGEVFHVVPSSSSSSSILAIDGVVPKDSIIHLHGTSIL